VATGEELWNERLTTEGSVQASPSLVGNAVLLVTTAGELIAVEAGNAFRELWRLQLEDEFYASPAFVGHALYLRGRDRMWCLVIDPVLAGEEGTP
jgi:hypothetical protein